jgi:O-acetyl-ADP-ribose deacetylase (regulator of RNase III)
MWVLSPFVALSLFSSIFYTAPPIRYGYHGLGEVFAGLNMGPVMVLGTYWIMTGRPSWGLIWNEEGYAASHEVVMSLKARIGASTLELVDGDITKQQVDAIVNAANAELAGGAGMDGAIHDAGGPEIMSACREIGGCPTGQAVLTTAGRLPADRVIHAGGPIYRDGEHGEAEQLASAYANAFTLAADNGLRTVAVPSLSTGAYGYPLEPAARVALGTAIAFLSGNPQVELIRFVLFGQDSYQAYRRVLSELVSTEKS